MHIWPFCPIPVLGSILILEIFRYIPACPVEFSFANLYGDSTGEAYFYDSVKIFTFIELEQIAHLWDGH
jgi:hypothetical protein